MSISSPYPTAFPFYFNPFIFYCLKRKAVVLQEHRWVLIINFFFFIFQVTDSLMLYQKATSDRNYRTDVQLFQVWHIYLTQWQVSFKGIIKFRNSFVTGDGRLRFINMLWRGQKKMSVMLMVWKVLNQTQV